jgi:hypothetical protein
MGDAGCYFVPLCAGIGRFSSRLASPYPAGSEKFVPQRCHEREIRTER